MKISFEIILLYQKLEELYKKKAEESKIDNKIEVDEISSHFSAFYEKLRTSVDFKEVHLLRRFAIERNIKRRFIMENLRPQIAQGLIEDLIRSRYLENNSIPEQKIKEVERIIEKYNKLFLLMNDIYHGDEVKKYFDWLIGVEACEIDICLHPEDISDAVIETMYQVTKPRIKLSGDDLSIKEKNIQLYIAIHKSLVKSDDTIISFHLLNYYFDKWSYADNAVIRTLATNIPSIYNTVYHHLRHPYQRKILQAIKEPVVTFQILQELILEHKDNLQDILIDPDKLQTEAKILINQKYSRIKNKVSKASIRAIIYIFITKIGLALLLELPYEIHIIQEVNYINLAINVVFPPLLMFLVTLSIIPPTAENTDKILENLHNLIYNKPEKSILCKLKSKYRKNFGYHVFYYFMYSALYALVFGFIIYWLYRLDFNLLSGGLFLFFLTAVSFFAIKIRTSAKEFYILKKKEGAISFLMNFFSLPVISAGRWMANRFRKLNVFAFVMDFIIEAPFKMFVAAFEDWMGFMKEKKEEVYHDNQQ